MPKRIMATTDATTSSNRGSYVKFFSSFISAHGCIQILIVSTVYAIGIGSVLGLLPQTLADRYARINHGFTDHCHKYATKPPACRAGSDDAQSAAAWSHVGLSTFLLLVNPIISSLSDIHGRKPVIVLALALSCIPALVFYVIIQRPEMNPAWYYVSSSVIGSVNYLGISFAAISDVIPEGIRAQAYGLLLSGYFGGYSLAPSMTIILSNDADVAIFSFLCSVAALITAIWFVPETLPVVPIPIDTADNLSIQSNVVVDFEANFDPIDMQPMNNFKWCQNVVWIWYAATRPLREISIVTRSRTLQLISLGSFCSAMVFSIDATLVIYYIQEKLDVQKSDIAIMTLALGIAGIITQGFLIHPIVSGIGEKGALILAFSCGTLHNFLYGSASTKFTIYTALIVSQLTKTNIPLLSSAASKEVEPNEQGRVQGALFAISAVGNAVGPILVQFIYHHTRSKFGSGSMFIYASVLYAIGTVVVSMIPNVVPSVEISPPLMLEYEDEPLTEPLLSSEDENVDVSDGGNNSNNDDS